MLVSIITSVFNSEKYISEMLNSILEQTYSDWELVIFDDASTDDTWNIISQYSDLRIKKYRNQKNQGLTVNLNKALKIAQGEYIVRIDGDDIAYPRRLEKQVYFMNQHPDVVLSGGWMYGFGTKNLIMQNNLDWKVLKINLLIDVITFHPTFIIRKDILDLYKISYNENLRYAQDYDIEYQLSKYGKIVNIPEILVKYRFHPKQVTDKNLEEQRQCAHITRKLVLMDLGINLNTEQSIAWQHFCMSDNIDIVNEEVVLIKNIITKIILNNKKLNIYDVTLLEYILFTRLEGYVNNTKNKSDKCCFCPEKNKYQKLLFLMMQWKKLNKQGIYVDSFLKLKNIRSVAIYGMGYVGMALTEELQGQYMEVKYGIDKNILDNEYLPILRPQDELKEVDAIIVTVISEYESIENLLKKKIKCQIFSLEDIIYSM